MRDSAWIVTRKGVWVPIGHNPSISETSPFIRASFTSLNGTRRVAGRGRGPRTWEVTETMPADWAQELYTSWLGGGGMEPVFFIPALAASTNYAPILHTDSMEEMVDAEGNSSWVDTAPATNVSDFFPIRPDLKVEFGARLNGGKLLFRQLGNDLRGTVGLSELDAEGMSIQSSKTITVRSPEARWGRLEVRGAGMVGDAFVRIATAPMTGVRGYGSGGSWATIDDFEISHGKLTTSTPLVNIEMTLTESERE